MCLWKVKKFDAFKNEQEINSFIRKVYHFLKSEHTIEFKYLRTCRGWMLPNQNPTIVALDPRENIVSTLIHEVLHFVYQDASETWVKRMEPRIYKQLSEHQICYIELLITYYM